MSAARTIIHEVEKWSDDLAEKPRWLVLNKIDNLPDDEVEAHCQAIVDELEWEGPVFKISALKRQGTQALMYAIMDFLEQQKQQAAQCEQPVQEWPREPF